MFSKVLDCPACNNRFLFEHDNENGVFPEKITCPECGASNFSGDFSAVIFCPGCRSKLRIPLDIINDPGISCPQCGIDLGNVNTLPGDDDMTTFTGHGADQRQLYRRLLQDGEQFDKYRIIRLLGKGGMAEVYLAEHLLLNQLCALKLMRSNSAGEDPVFVKRFLREAKLSHQFDHPNMVKVFDIGSDHQTGYLFIAMEYVEGKTLLELSREKQLSAEDLNAVTVAMCHALQCLSDANIVHRDIKPSNIMQNKDGVFKLMDLGIAKSASHQPGEMTLTMEQTTIGTPSYASPEQCQSAHTVDYRSDIYSLGATLYHAASGKLPFDGETAVETILKVLQEPAEPLENLRPDLPPDFLALVSCMMEKSPEKRPAGAAEILAMMHGNKKVKSVNTARNILKSVLAVLKSPIKLRVIAAVTAVVVIAINFKYLAGLSDSAAKTGMAKVSAAPAVKKSLFTDKQALLSYPEERISTAIRPGSREYLYPEIILEEKNYDILGKVNFAVNEYAAGFDRRMIRNNALQLDGSYPKLKNKAITPENITAFNLNALQTALLPGENCTLELDIAAEPQYEGLIARWGNSYIELHAHNRKLALLVGKNYYIDTQFQLPAGEWFNITVAIDGEHHKLSLLSGDRLIGIWMFPETVIQHNKVIFYNVEQKSSFQGRVGRITLKKGAVEYTIPKNYNRLPTLQNMDQQKFYAALDKVKNRRRDQRIEQEKRLAIQREAEIAAKKSSLAAEEKRRQEEAGKKAEEKRLALLNKWHDAPFGAGWFTDYEQAELQAGNGHPLLVLLVNPEESKSRNLIDYINENKNFNKYITANFTPLYLDCSNNTEKISERQKAYNQSIRQKLKAGKLQLPAFAVQKKFLKPALRFKHLKSSDLLSTALDTALKDIKQADYFANAEQRPVELRLAECRFFLKNLPYNDNSPLVQLRRNYLQRQIGVLTQLQVLRRNIDNAKKRSYSNNTSFRRKIQNYITQDYRDRQYYSNGSWHYGNRDRENASKELHRMLNGNGSVNPNLKVNVNLNSHRLSGEYTLLELALSGAIKVDFDLLELLKKKFADPDLISQTGLTRFSHRANELAAMGLNNIDRIPERFNGNDVPLLRLCNTYSSSAQNRLFDSHQPDFSRARDLLLYAPRVNNLSRTTPMHYAATRNSRQFAEDLVGAGFSEFDRLNYAGETIYESALSHGSDQMVQFLRDHNLTGNNINKNYLRQFEFTEAIRHNDAQKAEKLLKEGADARRMWWNNLNALQNACLLGHMSTVNMLLRNNVAEKNNDNNNNSIDPSLLIAVSKNNTLLFQTLLANGISAEGSVYYHGYRQNLLQIVCAYAASNEGRNLHVTFFLNTLKRHSRNFDIDQEINGRTALSIVCLREETDNSQQIYSLVKTLLDMGAKPFNNRYTVFSTLVRNPRTKALLEKAEKRYGRSIKKRKIKRKAVSR